MTRPPDDDFLSRWSRRKQDARHAPEPEPEPDAAPATEPAPEKTDEEILEELGLPDPDSLGPGADFKAFMAKAVPDRIRRRALRKLWLSNPALANLDQLVDYGEDYTDSATVVANLQSAYQVGRGYLDKLARTPEDAGPVAPDPEPAEASAAAGGSAEADERAAEAGENADPAMDDGETAASETETAESAGAEPLPAEIEPPHDQASATAPPRRRMRFDFEKG